MFNRNIVPILSAFALTTLFLLPAVLNAQERPQGTTAAPVEGAKVTLARYSGAQFGSARPLATFSVESDAKGNFAFRVVPEGPYLLTVEAPKDTDRHQGTVKWFNGDKGERVSVTLNLPGGKKIVKDYRIEKTRFFANPVVDRKIKRSTNEDAVVEHGGIIFTSDGIAAATGTITIRNPNGN